MARRSTGCSEKRDYGLGVFLWSFPRAGPAPADRNHSCGDRPGGRIAQTDLAAPGIGRVLPLGRRCGDLHRHCGAGLHALLRRRIRRHVSDCSHDRRHQRRRAGHPGLDAADVADTGLRKSAVRYRRDPGHTAVRRGTLWRKPHAWTDLPRRIRSGTDPRVGGPGAAASSRHRNSPRPILIWTWFGPCFGRVAPVATIPSASAECSIFRPTRAH